MALSAAKSRATKACFMASPYTNFIALTRLGPETNWSYKNKRTRKKMEERSAVIRDQAALAKEAQERIEHSVAADGQDLGGV